MMRQLYGKEGCGKGVSIRTVYFDTPVPLYLRPGGGPRKALRRITRTYPFFKDSRKSKKTKSLLSLKIRDSRELKNPDFSRLFRQQRREKIEKSKSLLFLYLKRREKIEKLGISTVFPFKKDSRKSKKRNLYCLPF